MPDSAVSAFSIATRFCGPPASGNGGYTSGRLAGLVGPPDQPLTVTLRNPPPLETPLHLREGAGEWTLHDGDLLIAEAAPGVFTRELVDPVDAVRAEAAHATYAGLEDDPFDACFVCGPGRSAGDGLRLFSGLIGEGLTACVWHPDDSLAAADGGVGAEFVWSALDCPGGWTTDMIARPLVLGRMTAAVERSPAIGEPVVVVGRLDGIAGRKTTTSTTAYGAAGDVVGRAEQVWIEVPPNTFYPTAT